VLLETNKKLKASIFFSINVWKLIVISGDNSYSWPSLKCALLFQTSSKVIQVKAFSCIYLYQNDSFQWFLKKISYIPSAGSALVSAIYILVVFIYARPLIDFQFQLEYSITWFANVYEVIHLSHGSTRIQSNQFYSAMTKIANTEQEKNIFR